MPFPGPWFNGLYSQTSYPGHPLPPQSPHDALQQCTTPTRSTSSGIFSSPLVEHESFIENDGLLTFCTWCQQEYKIKSSPLIDDPFDEAYHILRQNRITVDIMGGKSVEWYKGEGVASGTAERMAKSFPKWKAQLRK
jgi:hypothetical protein